MLEIELAGQRATLFAERALLLHEHSALLVADAHLGKAAAFRKLGVPVPSGTTQRNLEVISDLLTRTQARELIFLGDLFHNEVALKPEASTVIAQWCAWREQHASVQVSLIIGNHDAKALRRAPLPDACGIALMQDYTRRGNIELQHELLPVNTRLRTYYILSGHIHPAVILSGKAKQAVRLPCFWLGEEAGVLPAFGAFTGSHIVQPQANDRVFVIADKCVKQLPQVRW